MIVADVLTTGKVIRIDGGHVEMPPCGSGRAFGRRAW